MRILLLNWRDLKHPSSGGAEVWAHRIAEGLVLRGHDVTFLAFVSMHTQAAAREMHPHSILHNQAKLEDTPQVLYYLKLNNRTQALYFPPSSGLWNDLAP